MGAVQQHGEPVSSVQHVAGRAGGLHVGQAPLPLWLLMGLHKPLPRLAPAVLPRR